MEFLIILVITTAVAWQALLILWFLPRQFLVEMWTALPSKVGLLEIWGRVHLILIVLFLVSPVTAPSAADFKAALDSFGKTFASGEKVDQGVAWTYASYLLGLLGTSLVVSLAIELLRRRHTQVSTH